MDRGRTGESRTSGKSDEPDAVGGRGFEPRDCRPAQVDRPV